MEPFGSQLSGRIMRILSVVFGLLVCLAIPAGVRSAPGKVPDLVELLGHTSANALAGEIRGHVIAFIPPMLYETRENWGNQKMVVRGIKWKGRLRLRPQLQKNPKNHGIWRHLRVLAPNLRNTLILDIRNIRNVGPGRIQFDIFIAFDTRVYLDQQHWRSGIRVMSGSIRARARVKAALRCELTSRMEKKPGEFFPEAVFGFRVLTAGVSYDNFAIEHVYGLGGEMAQLIGDAAKRLLEKFRPSLEQSMIQKANAAIVKAAKTKEVRINFSKLFNSFGS